MTRRTLITFLGRVAKNESGYRRTAYAFPGEPPGKPVAFFGWTLAERLRPDTTIILGTSGSMWDHLFEGDIALGDAAEAARLELIDAVEKKAVSTGHLQPLEAPLSEALGCEVCLRLIPYCRTAREQTELLRIMAACVTGGDEVHIDVSHGFRHLPMLALLAALYLEVVRGIRVAGIWYGAYDPDTGKAPVHDLSGLLGIARWLQALQTYDKDGDYGVFSGLIDGSVGTWLEEASYLESINRIGQARSRLRNVFASLDELDGDPALRLFRPELERRIQWCKKDNYYLRQRQLALECLAAGRYVDAILKGWEAFISLLQREAQGESGELFDPDNHEHREAAQKRFEDRERQRTPRSERWRAYDALRRLRNAVAHGSQPRGEEVMRALSGAQHMKALLEELFARLLPDISP